MKSIDTTSFITFDGPILDVRSPAEYETGHIPGAISLPLFSNREREEVGIRYKNGGQKQAIKLGLKLVGLKMVDFVEQAENLGSDVLYVHCWRGGMRSGSMAWLLEQYGFEVRVLSGGYKSYRNYLLEYFNQPLNLRILTGYTGSAKTEVLHEMQKLGAQVIDLEGLANHQGSRFGNELSSGQPTTEQFQNDLLQQFLQLDKSEPVWLEDESISIGKVHLPEPLYRQMNSQPHVMIDVPKNHRIMKLVKNYGKMDASRLLDATKGIAKKLGKAEALEAAAFIKKGDLAPAADIILTYYDRQYQKGIERKSYLIQEVHKVKNESIKELAQMTLKHHVQY